MKLLKATSRNARSGRALFPPVWFSRFPLCICLSLLMPATSLFAQSLSLTTDTQVATAGYFQLRWEMPDAPQDVRYRLQERKDSAQFNTIYEGADIASVISGKSDGQYEYQVLALADSFANPLTSNPVSVEVKHHALTNALIMFVLGLIVFLSIFFVILRQVRNTGN